MDGEQRDPLAGEAALALSEAHARAGARLSPWLLGAVVPAPWCTAASRRCEAAETAAVAVLEQNVPLSPSILS